MKILIAAVLGAVICALPVEASVRSKAARADFQRSNPCPVTGRACGACPGYQVDHITPLKCKGADAPYNMQWLTVEQHKIKTAREAGQCRRR